MRENSGPIIENLRLSVTDRCNLRCQYCMPEEGVVSLPRGDILSYEELLHAAGVAVRLVVRKIRVSGGEPLVRKGVIPAVSNLFCGECNRIRVTADGRIRPCLFSEREFDHRQALRRPCAGGELETLLRMAVGSRQERSHLEECGFGLPGCDVKGIGG